MICYTFEISGKEKVNTFVKANTINSRGGFLHYRNGGNGRRGGYSNYPRYQNGANGQRGGSNGYNNRYQNGWYRVNSAKSSSRSSNGTDDGASGKAERSSVKSKRYLYIAAWLIFSIIKHFIIVFIFVGINQFCFQGTQKGRISEKIGGI